MMRATPTDLLVIIGEQVVEIRLLRARIAELEAQVKAAEAPRG